MEKLGEYIEIDLGKSGLGLRRHKEVENIRDKISNKIWILTDIELWDIVHEDMVREVWQPSIDQFRWT